MRATITFSTREQAEAFAMAWSRKTLTGHTISSGMENVTVDVFGVTDELVKWIDEYINMIKQ